MRQWPKHKEGVLHIPWAELTEDEVRHELREALRGEIARLQHEPPQSKEQELAHLDAYVNSLGYPKDVAVFIDDSTGTVKYTVTARYPLSYDSYQIEL